jgi:hypothetical protein
MMFRVVFWDILPCKMNVDRRFRGAYCLHHQGWVRDEDNSERHKIYWSLVMLFHISSRRYLSFS